MVKNPPANAGDSTPGLGRSPGGGNGNPFQCSCLENSMDLASYSPQGHKESDRNEHARAHLRAHVYTHTHTHTHTHLKVEHHF